MLILGLGSNLNDRISFINKAIDLIKQQISGTIVKSALYESAALLPENAPSSWNIPYLNMILILDSHIPADQLLKQLKTIEQQLGRKDRGIWGPREIDIDIIAYHDQIIDTPELTIPHRHLHVRPFVLFPLSDIAPNWIHPILKRRAEDLSNDLRQSPETLSCQRYQPLS